MQVSQARKGRDLRPCHVFMGSSIFEMFPRPCGERYMTAVPTYNFPNAGRR